eukprot:m.113000 g.113000  ORF g.113000 m.113000 type:complete len:52 (+) comp13496_c0_seq2:20-175(+)
MACTAAHPLKQRIQPCHLVTEIALLATVYGAIYSPTSSIQSNLEVVAEKGV